MILTTAQAKIVAAMFGMPDNTLKLTEDVDTALPDKTMLEKLRDRLVPTTSLERRHQK